MDRSKCGGSQNGRPIDCLNPPASAGANSNSGNSEEDQEVESPGISIQQIGPAIASGVLAVGAVVDRVDEIFSEDPDYTGEIVGGSCLLVFLLILLACYCLNNKYLSEKRESFYDSSKIVET